MSSRPRHGTSPQSRRNSATNKTLEDRHTVSEPRPVERTPNDGPSWEVDILRDDTVIVDTFLLNRDVLPPRINKKGKVLWKLPDTADKLVRLLCRIKLFIKTTSFFLRRNMFIYVVPGSPRLDRMIVGVSWIFSENERRNANRSSKRN